MLFMRKITIENATAIDLLCIVKPHANEAEKRLKRTPSFQLDEDYELVSLYKALCDCSNEKELEKIKRQFKNIILPLIEKHNELNNSSNTTAPILLMKKQGDSNNTLNNGSFSYHLFSPSAHSASGNTPTPAAPAPTPCSDFEVEL